ncbi:hypothetical protein ACJMK2_035349 [Sinanodonta woodiana]|uniref:Vesicular, overexpressed in cancer, prosurvival protein 1 n=1 Tax=Sinanodonta woodiana TaxID=1069815 RepID=A0ABD3WVZ5_SINWO
MWTVGISFLALIFVSCVQADLQCHWNYCTGAGVYCCGTLGDTCCWPTVSVVGLWWFWFIWVCFFFGIISCCIWICIRRRRANAGYIIVNRQPTYGSAISVTTTYNQPPPTYSTVAASAPSYMSAYQKPPAYN